MNFQVNIISATMPFSQSVLIDRADESRVSQQVNESTSSSGAFPAVAKVEISWSPDGTHPPGGANKCQRGKSIDYIYISNEVMNINVLHVV